MKKLLSLALFIGALGLSIAADNPKITCPNDVVTKYSCSPNHCFDAGKMYLGKGKILYDTVFNDGQLKNYYFSGTNDWSGAVKVWNTHGANIIAYNKPEFQILPDFLACKNDNNQPAWCRPLNGDNKSYTFLNPGESKRWVQTKPDYHLGFSSVDQAKFDQLSDVQKNNVRNYNFTIVYKLTANFYDTAAKQWKGSNTLNECQIVGTAWCGDGIVSPEYGEKCDYNSPNPSERENCNPTTCQPTPPTPACVKLNANLGQFTGDQGKVDLNCIGSGDVRQYQITIFDKPGLTGNVVKVFNSLNPITPNGSYTVNHILSKGQYSARCDVIDQNNIARTSEACKAEISVAGEVQCKQLTQSDTSPIKVNDTREFVCEGQQTGIDQINKYTFEVKKPDGTISTQERTVNNTLTETFSYKFEAGGNYQVNCKVNDKPITPACSRSISVGEENVACRDITIVTLNPSLGQKADITCAATPGTTNPIKNYKIEVTPVGGSTVTYTSPTTSSTTYTFTNIPLPTSGQYSATCYVNDTITAPTCTEGFTVGTLTCSGFSFNRTEVKENNATIALERCESSFPDNNNEYVYTCGEGGTLEYKGSGSLDSYTIMANNMVTIKRGSRYWKTGLADLERNFTCAYSKQATVSSATFTPRCYIQQGTQTYESQACKGTISLTTNPGGGGGGGTYECKQISVSPQGGNNYNVVCEAEGQRNITIDCGNGVQIPGTFPNQHIATGTCSYDSSYAMINIRCLVNGQSTNGCSQTIYPRDNPTPTPQFPGCSQIDPPAVNRGEYMPIAWDFDKSRNYTKECNANSVNKYKPEMCRFTLYNPRADQGRGGLKTFELPCDSTGISSNIFKPSSSTLYQTYTSNNTKIGSLTNSVFFDGLGKGLLYMDKNTLQINDNDNVTHGEYFIQLQEATYRKCEERTNADNTTSYRWSEPTASFKFGGGACQYNFVVSDSYDAHLGSVVSSTTPNYFEKWFYFGDMSTPTRLFTIFDRVQGLLTPASTTNSYLQGMYDEYNKQAKTVVSSIPRIGQINGKKLTNSEVYVIDENVTISGYTPDKPTTIISNETVTINGDIKGSVMIVAKEIKIGRPGGKISLEGIYVATNGLISSDDSYKNTNTNNNWISDARIQVSGFIYGKGIPDLIKSRRSLIDNATYFEKKGNSELLRNLVLDGASLKVSPNTTLMSKLPPLADKVLPLITKKN